MAEIWVTGETRIAWVPAEQCHVLDDPTTALREPGLTDDDRRWLQSNLALTGVCAPPGPPPVPIRHPWTPDDDVTRCLLCDDPETAVRHWTKERTDG